MRLQVIIVTLLLLPASLAGCAGEDPAPVGCTDVRANNYDADAVDDDGSCDFDADDDGVADWLEVFGCTDAAAFNYQSGATEEDGSCDYDYDDDGVLDADEIPGCMDSAANNFADTATDDDGSCDYDLDDDGILDADEISGCTDSTANNYNEHVTDDDGSCDYDLDDDGILDADEVSGCTGSTANNYDPGATDDDGSCDYDLDDDGILDADEVSGCTGSTANNYDSGATDDDGSCDYDLDDDGILDADEVAGCTHSIANNYDPGATDDDGSCDYDLDDDGINDEDEIPGCTDSNADNFDPEATDDDRSCEYFTNQGSILEGYDSGQLSYDSAWSRLREVRECTEDDIEDVENSPCEIVEMGIGDASTFDPHDAYDSASGDVIENVFDTLFRYEGDGNGDVAIVPRLATGFTIGPDNMEYTFNLRDGVHFSNGDLMTAEDVAYSWCRVISYGSPDSHVGWILEQNIDCDSLEVVDDTTFTVTLFQPYAGFVSTIAYTVGAVVNKDLCESNNNSGDHCHEWMDEAPLGSGTGAYIVESWIREDRIVLTPNWMYWEDREFNLNRITSSIVSESSTRLMAFSHHGSNGDPEYNYEADFGGINIEDLTEFCYIDHNGNGEFDEGEDDELDDKPNVRGKDGYICTYRETYTTTLAAMNLEPKDGDGDYIINHDCDGDGSDDCNVMANSSVRLAISYAFDYETARTETYDNSLAAQYGPIPTGFLYDWTQYEAFTYNLTYSEETLENAGFIRQYDCEELANNNTVVVDEEDRDGDECRLPQILRVMANEGNDYRIAMASQLQQSLGTIGVATDGDSKPWAEYLTMYYTSTFEIRFSGWAPDYLDPDNYWTPFAASHDAGGDAYGTNYHNPALDSLLVSARTEINDTARGQMYADAFELWVQDPNMIIIGQYNGIGVKHDDLCSAPWAAIGSHHWFDYDKIPVVDDVPQGSC
ncbi:MAG: hypothetical protein CMB35_02330 [Euryarchaeota archaeon]|nr:hypothetical protein [Euryarchaeota archaeon]